jgi:hypothetical protein
VELIRRGVLSVQEITAALLGIALLPSAAAQERQPGERGGFWFAAGLGVGQSQIECSRCGPLEAGDPWLGGTGVSGLIGLGGTPRRNLLLGAELNVWAFRDAAQQRDATFFLIALIGRYYPAPAAGGFFVKAGAGVGGSIMAGGPGLVEGTGWGMQAGGGYDVPIGGNWALSPFIGYVQLISEGGAGDNRGVPAIGPENPGYLQTGLAVMRR